MAVVFWDFDGTLVRSNPLWSSSVFRALKETDLNTAVAFTDIRKCMASGFTWHTPYNDYSQLTGDKWWDFMIHKIYEDYISLGVSREVAKAAADKVPSIIKDLNNYMLYDDTVAVLKKLMDCGNRNVILSNNYPDLDDVIKGFDIAQYFDDIIISARIGYDKPRKELFDFAKAKYPNDSYIMIGDKNANMKTILAHNKFSKAADFCFDNLSDIDFSAL